MKRKQPKPRRNTAKTKLPVAWHPSGRSAAVPVLTLREKQVLDAVLRGALDATIASELAISTSRVRKILSSLFEKFGAPSRLCLAMAWLRRTGAVSFMTP